MRLRPAEIWFGGVCSGAVCSGEVGKARCGEARFLTGA
jgi:hypothetical protein